MRTTVDIPDPVYRRLKTRAASEGSSVRASSSAAVEQLVKEVPACGATGFPPLVPSKRPGSLRIDNARIYDIIGFP